MEIPYRNGENHVGKGESSNYLECLDPRRGVEKGDFGNGFGDYLLNRYFPLERGEIRDKWCGGVFREFMR